MPFNCGFFANTFKPTVRLAIPFAVATFSGLLLFMLAERWDGLELGICDTLIAILDFCFGAVTTGALALGCPSNVELRINLDGAEAASGSSEFASWAPFIHTLLSGLFGCFLPCSTFFQRLAILLDTSLAALLDVDAAEFTLVALPCLETTLEDMVTVRVLSLLCKL